MQVQVKIEENFENHYEHVLIPNHQPPAEEIFERKKKVIVDEEDSKLPAVDNSNPPLLQANWAHRPTQEVVDRSRAALLEYTEEERHLLEHFATRTDNLGTGESTPEFPLENNNYILPVDIWVQVRTACECLRSRVLPFLTVATTDLEEEEQVCSLILLAHSRLEHIKGFPAEWIKKQSKWNIPGSVKVDKVTFEQVRFELWLYYYTCLQRNLNINYLLGCMEASNLDTSYL